MCRARCGTSGGVFECAESGAAEVAEAPRIVRGEVTGMRGWLSLGSPWRARRRSALEAGGPDPGIARLVQLGSTGGEFIPRSLRRPRDAAGCVAEASVCALSASPLI